MRFKKITRVKGDIVYTKKTHPKDRTKYEPIGTRPMSLDGNCLTYNQPFYAIRQTYLPMVKKYMDQILVQFLGELVWINI